MCTQNLLKWGKSVTFFYLRRYFLRFKKFLTANNNGYNYCKFDILRYESDCEKIRKIDNRTNFWIYLIIYTQFNEQY